VNGKFARSNLLIRGAISGYRARLIDGSFPHGTGDPEGSSPTHYAAARCLLSSLRRVALFALTSPSGAAQARAGDMTI